MKRRLVAGAAVVLGALVVSACNPTDPNAAEVNGHEIRRSDLEDELTALAASPEFVATYSADGLSPVTGSGRGTLSTSFAVASLNRAILNQLIEDEVTARGLTPTADQLAEAAAQVEASFGAAVATLPADLLARFARQSAQVRVLAYAVLGVADDGEALAAWLAADPSRLAGRVCVSHILVSTESEAKAALARVEAGEDFATVAAAVSVDGSAPSGGDLGCASPEQMVAEFAVAMASATPGAVAGPIQTQFGWHLLLVRNPTPTDARALSQDQANAALGEWLGDAASAARVKVDPRYGCWDGQQVVAVSPVSNPGPAGAPAPPCVR